MTKKDQRPSNPGRTGKGRPLQFFMTAGQVSGYTGAVVLSGQPARGGMTDSGYMPTGFGKHMKNK